MAIYGYARVSTKEQNLDRQIRALENAGVEYIYQEKISGKADKREQLEEMIKMLGKGDVVVVAELTRVSRSTIDLINVVKRIQEAGADIKSIKESWLDTTTSGGKLMLTIFAGLAEFERDLIVERVKDGMETAKANGVVLGRKPVNINKVEHAIELYNSGNHTCNQILDICGMTRSTFYRELRKRGIKR